MKHKNYPIESGEIEKQVGKVIEKDKNMILYPKKQ